MSEMAHHHSQYLSQSHERDGELTVETHRGLAFLLVNVDEEWVAEKIVFDAAEGIEWALPSLPFPSPEEARRYAESIIDAAFPRERVGDTIAEND
jgi:hypothetical protein